MGFAYLGLPAAAGLKVALQDEGAFQPGAEFLPFTPDFVAAALRHKVAGPGCGHGFAVAGLIQIEVAIGQIAGGNGFNGAVGNVPAKAFREFGVAADRHGAAHACLGQFYPP